MDEDLNIEEWDFRRSAKGEGRAAKWLNQKKINGLRFYLDHQGPKGFSLKFENLSVKFSNQSDWTSVQ